MYTIKGIDEKFNSIESAIECVKKHAEWRRLARTRIFELYKDETLILKFQVVIIVTTETHFIE
jgi:hypothetical protein